ncbi:hypothetical protein C8R45DRAFT_1079672 [Mycena sanguinolenta]|nr:hypothetical protein C8R45DRAFT_1079672 [Mycena sanguinolenta]
MYMRDQCFSCGGTRDLNQASRRTTRTAPEHTHKSLDAKDVSPTLPRTAQEQHRVPRRSSLQPDNPNPVVSSIASPASARHSEPVSPDPAPPADRTPAHRRADHPSSNEDPSTPSAVPTARKRHRNRCRNNPSSQTCAADTLNTSEEGNRAKRTRENADSERPAKRARKAASSPDGPVAHKQPSADTGFSGRQISANVATGSRATPNNVNARLGNNSSQVNANANQRMESPYVSVIGGIGGAGGPGGIMGLGGSGGNAMGPVFNMNFYIQR